MRWFLLLAVLVLCGFTRIHLSYEKPKDVQEEMANIENDLQPKDFRIVTDTPTLSDMRDGEIWIISFSSFTGSRLIWRSNQEIYSVTGSCITIRR